jgi:hypothetical protein
MSVAIIASILFAIATLFAVAWFRRGDLRLALYLLRAQRGDIQRVGMTPMGHIIERSDSRGEVYIRRIGEAPHFRCSIEEFDRASKVLWRES